MSSGSSSSEAASSEAASEGAAASSAEETAAESAAGCCAAAAAVEVFVPVQLFHEEAMGAFVGVVVAAEAEATVGGGVARDLFHLMLLAAGAVGFLVVVVPDAEADEAEAEEHTEDEGDECGCVVLVVEVGQAHEGVVAIHVLGDGTDGGQHRLIPVAFAQGGQHLVVFYALADGIGQGAFESAACEDVVHAVAGGKEDDESAVLVLASDAVLPSELHAEVIRLASLDALDHRQDGLYAVGGFHLS